MSERLSPVFYVSVRPDGQSEVEALDFDLTNRVLSLTYEDSEKKTDLLKLEVDNWDLSNFDDPIWKPGNTIIVTWGYVGNTAPQRECVIQKVTGGTKLTVEAQGKTVLLNQQVKSTTWPNKTRSEVVNEIARAAGYENASTRFIEETSEVFDVISQSRQTDAQFVKRLADLEGYEFFIDHSGFHWHPRRLEKAPLRVLQWYMPPDVGDIISFNVETDVFAKPAVVQVAGRDPLNKTPIVAVGADNQTNRTALAPIPTSVAPESVGTAIPTGIRPNPIGTPERVGVTTVEHLRGPQYQSPRSGIASSVVVPTTETSQTQVKREADGAYKRSVQAAVKLTVELVGDPGIVAKSVVEVRGISKRLSGLYYVTDATHSVSSSGYKLTLKCQADGTHGHVEDIASLSLTESKANVNTKRSATTPDKNALIPFQIQHKDGTLGPIQYVPADKVASGLALAKQGRGQEVGIVGVLTNKK